MKQNIAILAVIAIMFIPLLIFLSGCTQPTDEPTDSVTIGDFEPSEVSDNLQKTTQNLKKFDSKEDLSVFLQRAQSMSYGGGNDFRMMGGMAETAVGAPMMDVVMGAPTSGTSQAKSSTDFSQTNVQVEGVDEADFIKNDGEFIYMIADNKLLIVKAFPGEEAEIVSETLIDGQARNLFLNGDRVAVFATKNVEETYFRENDFVPYPRYVQKTMIYVYDVSNKEKTELKNTFSVSGSYYQSRMVGSQIYLVSQEGAYYQNPMPVPMVRTETMIIEPDIFYFDNPEQNYQYNTIASFDIFEDTITAKAFLMGYANTLMVSENNIYIAYQKQRYWNYYGFDEDAEQKFKTITLPLLPEPYKARIEGILSEEETYSLKWAKVTPILEEMWDNAETDSAFRTELDSTAKQINDKLQEFEIKKQMEFDKTVIQKFSINEGEINFVGKGEVSGTLLNQFSMDEFENNLRVATTTNIWAGDRIQYNNVFTLDGQMNKLGELTGIAKDEQIFSARFLGTKLYLVTFEQVDPLFVIDLSDARNPKILGELKITGFSSYLHPYDETHIIGVGKEADEKTGRALGLKIALFDVSDVSNPKLVDKFEIGGQGSDSEVLNDHKAFLFDKKTGLLVIPVYEREDFETFDFAPRGENKTWRGVYVFNVSDKGFELKGKIQHSNSYEDYWNWSSSTSVLRSLYMDDYLYTVSKKFIKVNNLNSLDLVGEVKLPYSEDVYYGYYEDDFRVMSDAVGGMVKGAVGAVIEPVVDIIDTVLE